MNLRTEISLLGILTTEAVLLTVYSSQPQRASSSKSSLHNYRPLRFSRCSHAQQKALLSSFSASYNVLVTYVLTVKRRGCQIVYTLRSGGPLADGRQVGLDRAPDLGSGRGSEAKKGPGSDLFFRYFVCVCVFFKSPHRETPKNVIKQNREKVGFGFLVEFFFFSKKTFRHDFFFKTFLLVFLAPIAEKHPKPR
jgi:hypothetical protein